MTNVSLPKARSALTRANSRTPSRAVTTTQMVATATRMASTPSDVRRG